jgi:hypothetical protein
MSAHCKIIAIAKNEATYIPQWIAHHLYFGFSEIEIWVNGTTDNSLPILKQIAEKYPNIKFKDADDVLKKCLDSGENFQVHAYQAMLQATEQEHSATHLICLDLDELWTPKDFETKIYSAIDKNSADAISFQWHLDTPNEHREIFSRPFHDLNTFQKNRHVKTIAKLGDKAIKANIHNFTIQEGNYSLQDGSTFEDIDNDQHNKSKVPVVFFNNTKSIVDDFFVVHQVYRSCEEYVASLSRGRSHAGDEQPIKVNRDGYILEPLSHHGLDFAISKDKLDKYNAHYEKFLSETKIRELLTEAKSFNQTKFAEVVSRVKHSKDFYLSYRNQFKGTKLNEKLVEKISYSHILFNIDQTTCEYNGYTTITGWAFDTLSNRTPVISFEHDVSITTVTKIERADVKKIHQDAPLDCGFRLTIAPRNPTDKSLSPENLKMSFKSAYSSAPVKIQTR